MADAYNKILTRMLDRLFAGLMNGPSLNCRPYSSRQRVDIIQLKKIGDMLPEEILLNLLGKERQVKLTARIPRPPSQKNDSGTKGPNGVKKKSSNDESSGHDKSLPADEAAREDQDQKAWSEQVSLLAKLRILTEDARTYEQDTGVHVLNLGFPLLSVPAGSPGLAGGKTPKRILAPIAFIPVAITIRQGATAAIEIACKGDGVDLVSPNTALLAWLEQQTGKPTKNLFDDPEGQDPWREIAEVVGFVAQVLDLSVPDPIAGVLGSSGTGVLPAQSGEVPAPQAGQTPAIPEVSGSPKRSELHCLHLQPAPRVDDNDARPAIILAGVIGLFPMNNQGLLRDTQAMLAGEALAGPVQSFIDAGVSLDHPPALPPEPETSTGHRRPRVCADERLITVADPCQARAVRLARECRGLVIHGPPGTGKSQTITNIIGDYLARGQRVLMLCDKRTALDVVANRLEHLGLGHLCALVHDPRRDQRELYRAIREQLESLTDATSAAGAEARLNKIDRELQKLHEDLAGYWALLMEQNEHGRSFHDLMGQWLKLPDSSAVTFEPKLASGVQLSDVEQHEGDLRPLLTRAEQAGFSQNHWARCAGISLADFLSRPMDEVRRAMHDCLDAGREADKTANAAIPPFVPGPGPDLPAQGQARVRFGERLGSVLKAVDPAIRKRWSGQDAGAMERARQKLTGAASFLNVFRKGPLDVELALLARAKMPGLAAMAQQIAALDAYLAVATKWYGLLFWSRRSEASRVLGRFGLSLHHEQAGRLRTFLDALRARFILQGLHNELMGKTGMEGMLADDEVLEKSLSQHALLFDLLARAHAEPALKSLASSLARALGDAYFAAQFIGGLQESPARAALLVRLQDRLQATGLFTATWTAQTVARACAGQAVGSDLEILENRLDTLEAVLRIRHELAALPATLRPAIQALLDQPITSDAGLTALRKAVLGAEITDQLRSDARFQELDRQRLQCTFERYRNLDREKRELVRDIVLHLWTSRQKEKLLVSTGSRLSGQGADLRRRLTMRGERALRLRQVVAVGQEIEGGDPLFDLRPLWMASPETVAQIFPRLPLFDVIIFDEASQCRLEEALPVLTRAHKVVIAGDPKQLPPTRFFESAVAASEEEEIETGQQLFEVHQGEIEDLLEAALGIDIQQCYLDVHYRSRNPDLIEFSNQQFYSSRLQPIPGHPANRTRYAPVTLYHAGGIYENRCNEVEADQVCQIVRDLLKRAEPPSIGIACFNISQRDLILEQLNGLALEDREFARKLGEARVRQGAGSFEGLFVKNLENVQGDERDHIIISTTYGPDPAGRFYRRFGPLGRVGGGRRLNVLVTRAREEVHLVTSIPPEVYRTIPPVPAGQSPGGGWLLFAYLAFAEQLAELYQKSHASIADEPHASSRASTVVNKMPSKTPSLFAESLAQRLQTDHQVGSDLYWGNEGFCVDIALHHPTRPEDVTIGVLCDGVRFTQAEDPMEWDLFRTAVLESQGWLLHRLWTPHFFRDVKGCTAAILRERQEFLATETEKDALKVVKAGGNDKK